MSTLVGARGQQVRNFLYDASGTITTGGTAQLVLGESKSRSSLVIQNISDTNMYFEFGSARATATISGGKVTAISVTNGGFGFTTAPIVEMMGGGGGGYSNAIGTTQPNYQAPGKPCKAHATLSGGAVNTIVIDDPGSGYVAAPYVLIMNSLNDPLGCATPSTSSGILLVAAGGSYYANGTSCTTDPIAVYCATSAKAFVCKWTD